MKRRIELAENYPEQSFIWWIEARKSNRSPRVDKLRQLIYDIYAEAWPERCQRMQTVVAERKGMWFDSKKRAGVVMYGPYVPLKAGSYTVNLRLKCDPAQIKPNQLLGTCDLLASGFPEPLCEVPIINPEHDEQGHFNVPLSFSLSSTTFGVQCRVIGRRDISIHAHKKIDLEVN